MYKIWLDYREGRSATPAALGRGGAVRFAAKAAQELGMSYNKAWRILHAAEQRLGFPLLDRSVGGTLGGGSNITPEARDLMTRYQALATEADEVLQQVFQRHFSDWKDPVAVDTLPAASPAEWPDTLPGSVPPKAEPPVDG